MTTNRQRNPLPDYLGLFVLASLLFLNGCDLLLDRFDERDGPRTTSDEVIHLPFFVRADDGTAIDPATSDPSTPLITDLGHARIVSPDGHQVTWGEWSNVDGLIGVACRREGTLVIVTVDGLIPHGVYTIWNVTFETPGFTGEFDAPGLPSNVKAFGPAGPADGSRSSFRASADGRGRISVVTPPGALGAVGEIGACALTDELEWHVVGLYHIDGRTHGPARGPDGTHAEQFAFVFKQD